MTARDEGASRVLGSLRFPAYRYVWASSLFSTASILMQFFARGLLAYQLGGTAAAISIVSLSSAIPQIALSLIGGTVADRFDKRLMIVYTQICHAAISISLSFLVYTNQISLTYLFVTGFIQGGVIAFGQPARQAFIPELVGEGEFMNAIALNNTAQNLCQVAAPSLAGLLVAIPWIDVAGVYLIPACLNTVSVLLMFLVPGALKRSRAAGLTPLARPGGQTRTPASMLRDMRDGMRYMVKSPILLTLLAMGLVPTFVGMSYQNFLPIWAKNVFGDGIHRNATGLGMLSAMSGVGAVLGTLTLSTLTGYRRRTQLQLAAGLGFGLFLLGFAIQGYYLFALVTLIGVGFMSDFYRTLNTTMVMASSAPEYYGRVMSVNFLTISLAPLGTFVMGFIIDAIGRVHLGPFDWYGVQVAYIGAGLIVCVFMLSVTVFSPSYRRMEQQHSPVLQVASASE